MKLIFAGSSEFAIEALRGLFESKEHEVLMVISQPPRPKGRKQIVENTPLANEAIRLSLPLFTPLKLNTKENVEFLKRLDADLIITASFGAFLGRRLRELCPYGAINLHPSLLPKYRGASPINTALLNGDETTGNTIFYLNHEMDCGDILMQRELKILENEDYGSLHQRLALQAKEMLLELLKDLSKTKAVKQDCSEATYSGMFTIKDYRIELSKSALEIQRQVRAFAPEPGAFVYYKDKMLKLLEVEVGSAKSNLPAGTVLSIIKNEAIVIAAGDGELRLKRVQSAGKKAMDAYAWSLGSRIRVGEKLE